MPVYRVDPYEPSSAGWQKSLVDPVTCWLLADDEADARATLMACAYGERSVEPENPPQPELLPWVAMAHFTLDDSVSIPTGKIVTKDGQRIAISQPRVIG